MRKITFLGYAIDEDELLHIPADRIKAILEILNPKNIY